MGNEVLDLLFNPPRRINLRPIYILVLTFVKRDTLFLPQLDIIS
jgi:hypothetical protein